MLDFTFQNGTKLIFGKNTQETVAQEIKPFSDSDGICSENRFSI